MLKSLWRLNQLLIMSVIPISVIFIKPNSNDFGRCIHEIDPPPILFGTPLGR